MGIVTVLGSGYAVAEEGHENTHFLIESGTHKVLVDCPVSPLVRLRKLGVDSDGVTELILTHFHADHVGGVPGFLVESWLTGRKHPLHIYGLFHTIDRLETMLGLYDWKKWPNLYPVIFHRLPDQEMSLLLEDADLRIYSSPVRHLIPTIGLRVQFGREGKILAYSCDTEPCQEVVELGKLADVLVHEATGASMGHSSAAQAGHIARQAEARALYLIHYSPRAEDQAGLIEEARKVYTGKVTLAVDGSRIEL